MFGNFIKIAWRNLRRHKAYSFINVMGLAIGMASCLLILIYMQDEFSYDRSHEEASNIYRLVMEGQAGGSGRMINSARSPSAWGPVLTSDFSAVKNAVRFKTPLSRWLINNDEKRMYERGFYFADASVFQVFDFSLLRGNPATVLVDPNTVVISESMAKKYFGNEDPVGKRLSADNNYDFTITGVMADLKHNSHIQFDFLASFATLEGPANPAGQFIYGASLSDMGIFGVAPQVYTYLLLEDGADPADLEALLPDFMEKYVGQRLQQAGIEMRSYLQPLTDIHLHSDLEAEVAANSDINYIYIFSAIVLFILVIACINFMNLATARSASRAKEVGLRKVVGSDRYQLIKQFIGESMLLAFLSMLVAYLLVYGLLPLFNNLLGRSLVFDPLAEPVLLGMLLIVVLVGFAAGSYPAFFLSSFQPAAVLKGALKTGGTRGRLRQILVTLQFAISIVFIIGTGVVYRQLDFVQAQSLGFDKEQVVVIPMVDPPTRFRYQSFKDAVSQHQGVVQVSAANSVPGGLIEVGIIRTEDAPQGETLTTEQLLVDHDFVKTLRLDLIGGRDFSISFPTDTLEAVVINETAAKQFGWGDGATGRRIDMPGFKQMKVIGVVGDFHVKSLHQRIEPLLIHLALDPDPFLNLLVRISPEKYGETLAFLQKTWIEVFPNNPFEFSFLEEDFDRLYRGEQQRGKVFIVFSLLAILIACLGLFGLASFTAEQRTKEIGIRRVLGGSVSGIIALLSREFVRLVVIANLIAWPVAYLVMNKWLENFAYRTNLGLTIFLQAAILAILIALLTVSYQSVKAALKRPADALKYE